MQYRTLGRTRLSISVLAFGAGPVSTLLVSDDRERQRAVIAHAIERGVNWFDTAATYGDGKSEENLGRTLDELGRPSVHVATKVRLIGDDLNDIRAAVRRSVEASLARLRMSRVTLLQLHNSVTPGRGDEPTSITPEDVLGSGGVADAFAELQQAGLVQFVGLTGIGNPVVLREVIQSGRFDTMQTPYHLLNPSAGRDMPADFGETNYGNIIADCAKQEMGVLAIRVLAGGALAGQPPSPHTLKTPFFPLDLYQRDCQRAEQLRKSLAPDRSLPQVALQFALVHPHIHAAIVGFGDTSQIDDAIAGVATERECEEIQLP